MDRYNIPRRKSCEACRAAKRRCDLALPTCLRCSRRRLRCVYPGLPSPELIPGLLSIMGGSVQSVPFPESAPESVPIPASAPESVPIPESVPEPELGFDNYITLLPEQQEYWSQVALTRMPTPLPAGFPSRLTYAIDRLRDVPRMMVHENQTPWCHPQLYTGGMPKAMQDVYASCALYLARTPLNAPVIATLVETRLQELLCIPQQGTESTRDILAHTQALILYLIMHLFEPTLRTNPMLDDALLTALGASARALFTRVHFPVPVPSGPPIPLSHPSPNSLDTLDLTPLWTLWILEESVRRTILASFFFIQLFKVLRGDRDLECDGKLGLAHSWYLSAHLWGAASAGEFAGAWAARGHLVVENVDFTGVFSKAQASDFDAFGRLLLVSVVGVDQASLLLGKL